MSPTCEFSVAIAKLKERFSNIVDQKIVLAWDFNVNWKVDSNKRDELNIFLQEFNLRSDLLETIKSTNINGTIINYIFHNFEDLILF